MKKQTAVEWLEDMIDKMEAYGGDLPPLMVHIQQAKEMEKQQIINTWYDCKLSIIDKNPTDADQYYNETYKK